ncbi:unnamed protein product, partial [Urochloa humidicola]
LTSRSWVGVLSLSVLILARGATRSAAAPLALRTPAAAPLPCLPRLGHCPGLLDFPPTAIWMVKHGTTLAAVPSEHDVQRWSRRVSSPGEMHPSSPSVERYSSWALAVKATAALRKALGAQLTHAGLGG